MALSVLEQHYQLVQHLTLEDKLALISRLQDDVHVQKPLNDLSKFAPRQDLVVGNSDDFVQMNWEEEGVF